MRSWQGDIARLVALPAQRCAQPWQPSAPCRPAKTVGLVAPSISGSATSIVASTGAEAAGARRPLAERLELERMRGDVGHVERGERVLGGAAVVVGRARRRG